MVAVSQWVSDVLRRNAVPGQDHIVPPGNRRACTGAAVDDAARASGPAEDRLFWPDRPRQGPRSSGCALKIDPQAPVQVDIFAIRQTARPDQVYDWLGGTGAAGSTTDPVTAVAPDKVVGVMADYDLIAVPSRCLETGPLVALEAFAAGVPVLGAKLGGIAELVRDGVDGILVTPDNAAAWAAKIGRLAKIGR